MTYKDVNPTHKVRLINADGYDAIPLGTTTMEVNLGNLETDQDFAVVDNLSAPAILVVTFSKKKA